MLTRYILITAVVLSLTGCFNEDAKSSMEEVIVAPQTREKVIGDVKCWYSAHSTPTHDFEVVMINNSINGRVHSRDVNFDAYVKGVDGYVTLSIKKCQINFH